MEWINNIIIEYRYKHNKILIPKHQNPFSIENINTEKYNKEIEKKEKLIQTYLLICSFLTFTFADTSFFLSEDTKLFTSLFIAIVILSIIYYVYISSSEFYFIADICAWMFSFSFMIYIYTISIKYSFVKFDLIFLQILLYFIYFSLLSPQVYEEYKIIIKNKPYFKFIKKRLKNENKAPVYIIIFSTIGFIIISLIIIWNYINDVLFKFI